MDILIITSLLPYPLNSGGAQAQYNMIDKLRKRHNIVIVVNQSGKNSPRNIKELRRRWPEVKIIPYSYLRQLRYWKFVYDKAIRAFKIKFTPNSKNFFIERALRPYGVYFTNDFISFIKSVISSSKPDVIQVDFYPYIHIVNFLPKNIKCVFIHHEIRYIRNERLLADLKLSKKNRLLFEHIRQEELSDLNKYDKVVTLTNTDKDILIKDGVTTQIEVSPAAINSPIIKYKNWDNRILFIGSYVHKPNVEGMDWFIDNVTPLLNDKLFDNVSIHLIGSGWNQDKIMRYKRNCHMPFKYHGFVDDITTIAPGAIMIVPILTGSGMRMKILEAAALGLPFITTNVGVEGLDFSHSDSCVIGNTPIEWKNGLELLVSSEETRRILTKKALDIYNKKYSVETLVDIREHIYDF